MINRLSIKPLLCKSHSLPLNFICLDPKCLSSALLCSHCIKKNHSHYDHVLTIEQFRLHCQGFLEQAKSKWQEDKYPLRVQELVQSKKQEIEKMQLELMELVMKKMSEEKKRMFEALESIERTYSEKEHYFQKHQQMRADIIKYVNPLIRNQELFELKMYSNSDWGIARLKENLVELEKLLEAFGKKDVVALEQAITREINSNADMEIFKNIRCNFRERIKSQPLLFIPTPPVKKYSFKSRQSAETASTRPRSSEILNGNSKPCSLDMMRPVQTRSHIML